MKCTSSSVCCKAQFVAAWLSMLLTIIAVLLTGIPAYAADGHGVIAWSPDGRKIAVSSAAHVLIYRLEETALNVMTVLDTANVTSMAWHTDRIALGTADGVLSVWQVTLPRPKRLWWAKMGDSAVRDVIFNADGSRIAAVNGTPQVRQFNAGGGKPVSEITCVGLAFSLTWLPNGTGLAVGGAVDGTYERGFLGIWDNQSALARQYTADMRHALKIRAVGSKVAILTRYEVFTWDPVTDFTEPLSIDLGENATFSAADWQEDRFATVIGRADGSSRVNWRYNGVQLTEVIFQSSIGQVAWQPNGSLLAAMDAEGTLSLLDGASGEVVAAFTLAN